MSEREAWLGRLEHKGLAHAYPIGYKVLMNAFVRASEFDAWLSALDDDKAKARILARLRSATLGNFGDC